MCLNNNEPLNSFGLGTEKISIKPPTEVEDILKENPRLQDVINHTDWGTTQEQLN